MEDDPAGQTPLCEHIESIVDAVSSIEDELRASGQRAIVIIATDGVATDGNVAAALRPLERLPVIVILRLCTSDEKVVKYWDDIDKELELEMDVLDDLCGDASQVVKLSTWLTSLSFSLALSLSTLTLSLLSLSLSLSFPSLSGA